MQKIPVNVSFGGGAEPENISNQQQDQFGSSEKKVLKKNKASFISLKQSPNGKVTKQLMPKNSKSIEKHLREIETFYAGRR